MNCFSDHKVFKISLCLPDLGRDAGNGYWAMRSHVLTEDNIEEFGTKWNYWCRQRRNFNSWIEWWIIYAKPRIKGFFRKKTNDSFREFHTRNEFLYARLKTAYNELYQDPNKISEVNLLKGKMLRLQREFSKKFIRINDQCIGKESISSYQLGDRMRKKSSTFINPSKFNSNILSVLLK